MSFIRKIKTKSGTYLAEVENRWEDGKVRQKFIRYIGKEVEGKVIRHVAVNDLEVENVKRYADVLVLDHVATALGLKDTLGPKFQFILILIYSHILERMGIYRIEEWLNNTEILEVLGLPSVSTSQLYDALGALNELDWAAVQRKLNAAWLKFESCKRAVVLDVTDTYFSGHSTDCKPRRGKDGVVSKLIQVALGVSFDNGFPLLHKMYDGNIHNVKIFEDMLAELKTGGISGIIMDRGMYSEQNLDAIDRLNITSIVGVRKTPSLTKSFLADLKREEIFNAKCQVCLKNTTVYATAKKYREGEIVIVYHPQIEVAERERSFEDLGKKRKEAFGFSLIYHTTALSTEAVVHRYFDKDVVERAFRQLKGPLSLCPIRVWLRHHVEAHVRICYLAYAVYAFIGYKLRKLKIAPEDAVRTLQTAYKVRLMDKSLQMPFEKLVTLTNQQAAIIKKLGLAYKTAKKMGN